MVIIKRKTSIILMATLKMLHNGQLFSLSQVQQWLRFTQSAHTYPGPRDFGRKSIRLFSPCPTLYLLFSKGLTKLLLTELRRLYWRLTQY